ncbi:HipA family kinase [Terracidiphilus gabretensis]|uniref:HipA family kinase n=1 Tax=Terracidiphilus gabretensis TaxID=1577687 RepID=UPI0018D20F12|nr:HipA family kinase [Terracidiphilus gabretensis]
MAVDAVQHIRRMRGGAQGQLMLGEDGHVYVVKFQNNPQHTRVLANEFLATRLARAIGLTTPQADLIDVSEWLIENTPELEMDLGRSRERCKPGLHFGSRFAGGLMPGQVVDYLPEEQLAEVKNIEEFAGVLALDKWTGNANGRQAVFVRKQRERRYTAHFIDFGYCFHAGEWRFEDLPLRGIYYRNVVYREVRGWESFDKWLSRIEKLSEDVVWEAVNEIPHEWYGGNISELEALVEKLLARRGKIRELIEAFGNSDRQPFPNWGLGDKFAAKDWNDSRWEASIEGRVN